MLGWGVSVGWTEGGPTASGDPALRPPTISLTHECPVFTPSALTPSYVRAMGGLEVRRATGGKFGPLNVRCLPAAQPGLALALHDGKQ